MRAQTSIEFMLILSAVSILSLSAISLYTKGINVEHSAFASDNLSYITVQSSLSNESSNSPVFSFAMPLNSSIGDEGTAQMLAYGCQFGSLNISLSSNTLLFNATEIRTNFSGLYLSELGFVPISVGIDHVSVRYSVNCKGSEYNGTSSPYTDVIPLAYGYTGYQYSATISNISESIIYNESALENVSSFNEWSRCTQIGFWGNPYGINAQCGTYNAWEYNIFSMGCYTNGGSQTETFCIVPENTGFLEAGATPASAPSYTYAFTINLTTPTGNLSSTVISSRGKNLVYAANRIVGTASVQNISYTGAINGPLLWHAGSILSVNPALYAEYSQSLTNVRYLLWYYNKTDVSSPEQSAIQQAMAAYGNASATMMRTAKPASESCSASGGSLRCTPRAGFTYVIRITLNDSIDPGSTVYYNGSEIEIA